MEEGQGVEIGGGTNSRNKRVFSIMDVREDLTEREGCFNVLTGRRCGLGRRGGLRW